MLLIYRDFEGNLPFTGIIREVYGLPYATSTLFPDDRPSWRRAGLGYRIDPRLRDIVSGTTNHFSHITLQVADQYAFIPREAISKFLLFCIDCQRKNSMSDHRGGGGGSNGNGKTSGNGGAGSVTSERSSSADSPSVMDVGGGAKDIQGESEGQHLLLA